MPKDPLAEYHKTPAFIKARKIARKEIEQEQAMFEANLSWREKFNYSFNKMEPFGAKGVAIYAKDGSMLFDENHSQLGAIKNFIDDLLLKQKSELEFLLHIYYGYLRKLDTTPVEAHKQVDLSRKRLGI